MKLSQFKFDLPLNLIAQHPAKKREDARMMVVHRKTGQIENKNFKDILEYFDDKDVFTVNNTKVFPARMYGRKEKTGAKIEVFLPVSYTHLRAHETGRNLVCRLLLEKKKKK